MGEERERGGKGDNSNVIILYIVWVAVRACGRVDMVGLEIVIVRC